MDKGGTATPWQTEAELNDLIDRFHACRIDKAHWTHSAHLAVGTWHVREHGPTEALNRLRDNIRRLNESNGLANTESAGYHETVTRAYVLLIANVLNDLDRDSSALDCVNAVLSSDVAAANVLLTFYTAEVLMSAAARRAWVDPDREPIPSSSVQLTGGIGQ